MSGCKGFRELVSAGVIEGFDWYDSKPVGRKPPASAFASDRFRFVSKRIPIGCDPYHLEAIQTDFGVSAW
jgi:hypothetical protein